MDLVTITCNKDFNSMLLQARSVEKYLKHGTTHWIFINEEEQFLFDIDWETELKDYYNNHILKIVYCDPTYWNYVHNGWVLQQIHKLEAVKIVNDDYLLLDSKNFFVVPSDLDTWQSSNGCGVLISEKINLTVWNEWNNTNDLYSTQLGVPKLDIYYAAETPFVIKREIAQLATNRENFAEWFCKYSDSGKQHEFRANASEFIYYSYFLRMQEHQFEYNRRHHSLWPEYADTDSWFSHEDYPIMEISGIHRVWIERSSDEDKNKIVSWLSTLDLINEDTIKLFFN